MSYSPWIAGLALFTVSACTQNDTDITRRVQARLDADGVTDQVHVTTERRIVHLEGVVADTRELNRVEMDARNTRGIIGVDNRLVVQNPVDLTGATTTPPAAPAAGPAQPTTPSTSTTPAVP